MKRNVKRHAVVQPLDQSYRYIPLTHNLNAIVDLANFDYLNQWNWSATSARRQGDRTRSIYAFRWEIYGDSKKQIFMHRVVAKTPDELITDHISGDGLDNRGCNLRTCTPQQNSLNRGKQANNTSGYKGIQKRGNLWIAEVGYQGKRIYAGCSKDPAVAAEMYAKKSAELFGGFNVKSRP